MLEFDTFSEFPRPYPKNILDFRVSRNLNRKTFCTFGNPETLTEKHFALSGNPKLQPKNILSFRETRKPFQENLMSFRETRRSNKKVRSACMSCFRLKEIQYYWSFQCTHSTLTQYRKLSISVNIFSPQVPTEY